MAAGGLPSLTASVTGVTRRGFNYPQNRGRTRESFANVKRQESLAESDPALSQRKRQKEKRWIAKVKRA